MRSLRAAAWLLGAQLLLSLSLGSPSRAQDQKIAQMIHSIWAGRDGAPLGIRSVAQTSDGILWIASVKGLYSFDGLSFVPFQPAPGSPQLPGKTLRLVFPSKSGDLWVAGYHGPAFQIHQGQVVGFGRSDEPINAIDYLQQDSTDAMWAVVNDHLLVRLDADGIWRPMPDPLHGRGHMGPLFIDSMGTQWLIENNVLYRRPPGREQFVTTEVSAKLPVKIKEGVDHTLWIVAPVLKSETGRPNIVKIQHVDRSGRWLTAPTHIGDPIDVLPGTDGSLWVLKTHDQLQHLQSWEISERHSKISDEVNLSPGVGDTDFHALMLDGDGDVWAGGLGGLHRFAHAALVPAIPGSRPDYWHSCVDSRGDVFISDPPRELYRIRNGRLSRMNAVKESGSLFCGPGGTLYMEANGIVAVRNGKETHLPLLPGFTGYGSNYVFTGVLPMPDGSLIGAVGGTNTGTGLWVYEHGKWSRFLPNKSFPETTAMFLDSAGTIYLGHINGDIDLVSGNVLTTLTKGSTQFSAVLGFAPTSYGVFAYGPEGIAVIRPGNFQLIKLDNSAYSRGVTGLVEGQNGDIWINSFVGLVHIPSAEIRAALADPNHSVSATNLEEQDFKGPSLLMLFSSTAHIDRSGELWFSTLNGVVSVDPRHLVSPRPPLLTIRSITGDGSAPNAHNEFPPNLSTLDVQYLGVNLSDPRRVVYRYQLQGLDRGWQNVGHRNDAIFTHLRPGRYIFRVMASNGDGAWTDAVASEPFTVLPSFYETWWFGALCIVTCAGLIWFGISARVRYISAAIRIRAEERADERVRIARELHDTLLQGVQGLLLSFHVAAEKVPSDHVSKKALEKALTTADRIIVEGRNRVSRLRAENVTDAELKSLIQGVADNLPTITPIEFAVERTGGSDTLRSQVVDEVFCIAREALTNAFRHSGGSNVVVELDYQEREFSMSCRDNGRGFDSEAFCALQSNGHWGIRGMEERAQGIGAKLSLTSAADEGTEVHFTMPARLAYVRHRRFENFLKRMAAA